MKVLIITVAGMSNRFSESLGYSCLKCIYYRNSIEESLLYKMLYQKVQFDKYIIVGGFMFEKLEETINRHFTDILSKIILVKNKKYKEYGSGYSLYLGICEAIKEEFDELVFAEGDLFVDAESFRKVYDSELDVITCNREAILADKAVAYYYDIAYGIHYIYDTCHKALSIREPILGIFNSGQIWKFRNYEMLKHIVMNLTNDEQQGTNLVIIQKYFSAFSKGQYEVVQFNKWINCNTLADFKERDEWIC